MIGRRLASLAVERDRLQARAAEQRAQLAQRFTLLSGPIGALDRSVDGVRWLREHPAAWAIGLIAAAALRPRGVFGFARNGFRLWAAWQALRVPKARLAARVLPQVLDWYRTWKSRRR